MHAAHEFLNAAKEVADGRPIPTNETNITQKDVQSLLKDLAFVESESGQVNAAKALSDLLPLVHIFRMFHGYDPIDILTRAM